MGSPQATPTRPYLGYRRISRVGDREERLRSPEMQAEDILRAAAREGIPPECVELLPVELDVSGGKEHREILDAAMARIEAGEAAGFILKRYDRLSRLSIVRSLALVERVEKAKGAVVSHDEPGDGSTPSGEFSRTMWFAMARMQRAVAAEGFEASKRAAIEAGYWTAPKIPLGYRHPGTLDAYGNRLPAALAPDEGTAPVLREHLFEARARGDSWTSIARAVSTPLGMQLNERSVQRICRSRVYLGESKQGNHINATAHPPLVDEATWLAAQRQHPRPARNGKPKLLLGGLTRCGTCGYAMCANSWERGRSYTCSNRIHCTAPARVMAARLDPYVERVVLATVADDRVEATLRDGDLDAALAELATAERLLTEYNSPEVQEALGLAAWVQGLAAREQRVREAGERVAEVRAATASLPKLHGKALADVYYELTHDERRAVMSETLERIVVQPGRGEVSERVRIDAR